ncbi:MAG: YceD family protein [Pelagimonas sp.]|uniref:YceD family protein n=1 Tax=Pelagimonas sp. TaxID=2073170 RepID=UPI003D6A02F2
MPPKHPTAPQIPVSELRQTGATPFLLEPNAEFRNALAQELNAQSLRKIRFIGEITPQGRNDWRLKAKLGATAVQSCIVTLEPVTTRIDTDVTRSFVPAHKLKSAEEGSETEMSEDDDIEELGDEIDLEAILAEALSLALPSYPRVDGAEIETAQFSADGVTPMNDEDMRPFAGLAALRNKMQKDDGES